MENNYKIKYLPIALQDLIETAEYITFILLNPEAADSLLDEIDRSVNQLKAFPFVGALYKSKRKRKQQYRMIFIRNHTVYYAVIDDSVVIQRILYKRRNIKNLLEEEIKNKKDKTAKPKEGCKI